MNIEKFKRDLIISDFLELIIKKEFGYDNEFNMVQLNEIKNALSDLYFHIENHLYYIIDKTIICYKVKDDTFLQYVDHLDISMHLVKNEEFDYKFKTVIITLNYYNGKYLIKLTYIDNIKQIYTSEFDLENNRVSISIMNMHDIINTAIDIKNSVIESTDCVLNLYDDRIEYRNKKYIITKIIYTKK